MHASLTRRPSESDVLGSSTSSASDSSLLPKEWTPQQLFRTKIDPSHVTTFAHLPRIVLQLVNGYLSLKEIGSWCSTSRDVYATCAFFRCPLNTLSGGIRHRWLVLGQEFSRQRLKGLLESPLRIHVTVCEGSDPHGGLLRPGDLDLMRRLPFLTDVHAHYTFSKPFDWAEEVGRLVCKSESNGEYDASSSSSSDVLPSSSSSSSSAPLLRTASLKAATLPPFRALMLCPHDSHLDGEEIDDEDDYEEYEVDDSFPILTTAPTPTPTPMTPQKKEESKEEDTSASSSSAASASSSNATPKPKIKRRRKKVTKKPPQTHMEMLAEEEKLMKEEKEHLALWTIYNEKLFSMLPRFGTLETLGLNMVGNCTNWKVDGFRILFNLHTIELDVENPWNFAFSRQLSDIIEYIRDIPYRNLRRFQSNGLQVKHLQQLMRRRLSSDVNQESPPCWKTLYTFKVYADTIPEEVRVMVDQWEAEQDERFILPYVAPQEEDESEHKYQKRLKSALAPLGADDVLDLYSRLPQLRQLDLIGFATPLSSIGLHRLREFEEVDTLCLGGAPPPQHQQQQQQEFDLNNMMQQDHVAHERKSMLIVGDRLIESIKPLVSKKIKIERLTLSYMDVTPNLKNEDPETRWTPHLSSSPTSLHDLLYHFASNLLELDLHVVTGLKDLKCLTQCTKLVGLKLTALRGFTPTYDNMSIIGELRFLRSLRISHMVLPESFIEACMVPSTLIPSLEDFAAEQPRLALLDGEGQQLQLEEMQGFNFQQIANMPGMGWFMDWLQAQGVHLPPPAADAAGGAAPPAVAAPLAAGDALQLAPLMAQLYQNMVAAGGAPLGLDQFDDGMPELDDEDEDEDEDEDDQDDIGVD